MKIAWDVQRFRTAQTWKIIQLLYGILEPVDNNAHNGKLNFMKLFGVIYGSIFTNLLFVKILDKEGTDNLLKDSSFTNPSKSSYEIKESDSTKDLNIVTEKNPEALDVSLFNYLFVIWKSSLI